MYTYTVMGIMKFEVKNVLRRRDFASPHNITITNTVSMHKRDSMYIVTLKYNIVYYIIYT